MLLSQLIVCDRHHMRNCDRPSCTKNRTTSSIYRRIYAIIQNSVDLAITVLADIRLNCCLLD